MIGYRYNLLLILISVIIISDLEAQTWQLTGGPEGGNVRDFGTHPTDTSIMYAVGRKDGIYKSEDYGASWILKPYGIETSEHLQNLLIPSTDSAIILCSSNNDLIKSSDGGDTWKQLTNGFNWENKYHTVLKGDPLNPEIIYTAGGYHDPDVPPTIYMSIDIGENWTDIGVSLSLPTGVFINDVCALGDGKILIGVNDEIGSNWGNGKVFFTPDYGASWSEVNYNPSDNRFISGIHACAYDLSTVWITEMPIHDGLWLENPDLFQSTDGGSNWQLRKYQNGEIRIVGSSKVNTTTYFTNGWSLYESINSGASLEELFIPDEIPRHDLNRALEQINNPEKIFLNAPGNGIIFSPDGGISWRAINKGIVNSSISHISIDPSHPGKVYAVGPSGSGIFKTENYGESWERPAQNGIWNPWPEELVIDPNSSKVWFVSDVPFIHNTSDGGENWTRKSDPYAADRFNFSSIYAIATQYSDSVIYVANNGYGIYRGVQDNPNETFHWTFLERAKVDFTSTIETEPHNDSIIYSGYNSKPFEDSSMIRVSYNRGENWFNSHIVQESEAITSIEVDPGDYNRIIAASTGNEGILWESPDKGLSWDELNPLFRFTSARSFAVYNSIAYASTGGGLYRSLSYGNSWVKLESDESETSGIVAIANDGSDIIYMADRLNPILFRSMDNGLSWDTVFNAGEAYAEIIDIEIDPQNSERIFVSVMSATGNGSAGNLFKLENNAVEDVTNELPRLPRKLKLSPSDSLLLYCVLQESGVYKSINGGDSWIEISGESSGLPISGFNDLLLDPGTMGTLYLIGGSDIRYSTNTSAGLNPETVMGVYRSIDAGNNWENINRGTLGFQSGAIYGMSFLNDSSDVIYLASENGIFYTTDKGNSWLVETDFPYNTLNGIAISDSTIYAFTRGAGVFTGDVNGDYSISWDQQAAFNNEITHIQVLKHPAVDSVWYTSSYPGGIFKSYDNGATWHEKNFGIPGFNVNDPSREGYYILDISRANPDVMYLGLSGKGIYRSKNGGNTWYPVHGVGRKMSGAPITCLVSDLTDENLVYVGTLNGMFLTENGGITWSEFSDGMGKKEIHTLILNNSGILHAGTRGYGLYSTQGNSWYSNEGFNNWGSSWLQWRNRPLLQNTSLLIHPENNQRIMLGTFPQGIYYSEDGGETWRESNQGFTNLGAISLVCHPDNPEIVFAGTNNGLNVSYDFGRSWEVSNSGWPNEHWVKSIDFDPVNPDIMYACSENGEDRGRGAEGFRGTVMKSLDGGKTWNPITSGLNTDQVFYKVICDRVIPGVIYLACQHEGIYRSSDGGNTWNQFNSGLGEIWTAMAGHNSTNSLALSEDNSILYFGTSSSGIYRSLLVPILSVQELHAVKSGRSISLDWNFTDIADNFESFNIYRSDSAISELSGATLILKILSADIQSYLDTSVVEEGIYYYAVTVESTVAYETENFPTAGPTGVLFLNNAPELSKDLYNLFVRAEEYFDYTIPGGTFIDRDNDNLIYTVAEVGNTSLPDWLNLDLVTLTFSGTPTLDDVGQFDILVTVTDPFEASVSEIFSIFVSGEPIGINERIEESLHLFPNPADRLIILERVPADQDYTVVMFDIRARRVLSNNDYSVLRDEGRIQIDIGGLDNGMYIVVVKSKNSELKKLVVIQH